MNPRSTPYPLHFTYKYLQHLLETCWCPGLRALCRLLLSGKVLFFGGQRQTRHLFPYRDAKIASSEKMRIGGTAEMAWMQICEPTDKEKGHYTIEIQDATMSHNRTFDLSGQGKPIVQQNIWMVKVAMCSLCSLFDCDHVNFKVAIETHESHGTDLFAPQVNLYFN